MILETGVQTILVINCEIIFALVQKTGFVIIGPKKAETKV